MWGQQSTTSVLLIKAATLVQVRKPVYNDEMWNVIKAAAGI